jgi:hypothetical protein
VDADRFGSIIRGGYCHRCIRIKRGSVDIIVDSSRISEQLTCICPLGKNPQQAREETKLIPFTCSSYVVFPLFRQPSFQRPMISKSWAERTPVIRKNLIED